MSSTFNEYSAGQDVEILYKLETTAGTKDTADMTEARLIAKDISLERNTLESEEVDTSGFQKDVLNGFNAIGGTLTGELSTANFEAFFRSVAGNNYTTGSTISKSVTSIASSVITLAAFTRTEFRVGDIVVASGMFESDNDGEWVVTEADATANTIKVIKLSDGSAMTDTTSLNATGSVALDGRRLDFANNEKCAFTVQRMLKAETTPSSSADGAYEIYTGVTIDSMTLNYAPESILTADFGILGMGFDDVYTSKQETGTTVPAGTGTPYASFSGYCLVDGVSVAYVTEATVNIERNGEAANVIFDRNAQGIIRPTATVSGSMTIYFDETMNERYLDDTETTIVLIAKGPVEDQYINVTLPRVKFTSATPDIPNDGPLLLNMDFLGLYDAATGVAVSMQVHTV